MSQARLREALTAGGASTKDKGPPVADGVLEVTPDTPESIEWRSRQSVIDAIASSSTYLDDAEEASQPVQLYGKYTWTVDKFAEVSKRELRSGTFEAGGFKWYILVYPQGCDVANHLSLFLCVAEYDKLLPGWSHFAQFTVAVSNRDPKKSKYSDTLHRFCKKEHDWGWKKFMELGKIGEGFTAGDKLVIKAQVQVIRDRLARPFRTLDSQYRRELVRVYLANVEGIARRFVDEKRERLPKLLAPTEEGGGFVEYWRRLVPAQRAQLATEPAAAVYKALVKRFFNEKEVTSTLVMDALYCGAKVLEEAGRIFLGAGGTAAAPAHAGSFPPSGAFIDAECNAFFIAGDVVKVLQRCAADAVPAFTPDKPADASRDATAADEYSRESVERDERRLVDLGRRCVEMFAVAHIVETRLESAWAEAETIKRQEELIREEEAAEVEESAKAVARAEAEREKRARKKEKQQKKKEVERAKREAEEAVARLVEEERRAAAEKRQRESEERRRKEEAEREADHERQAAAARQHAEDKKRAEAAAKVAAKGAAKAAARAAKEASAAHCLQSESSSEDAGSALGSARSDLSVAVGNGLSPAPRATRLPDEASSAGNSRTGASDVSRSNAKSAGRSAAAPAPASTSPSSRAVQLHVAAAEGSGGEGSQGHSQMDASSAQLRRMAQEAAEKDAEIGCLRSRVAELEGQLAAALAAAAAPSSAPSSRPGSALSNARSPSASSDADHRSPKQVAAASLDGSSAAENGHVRQPPRAGSAPPPAAAGLPPGQPQTGGPGATSPAPTTPSGLIFATASMAAMHHADAQRRAASAPGSAPPRPAQIVSPPGLSHSNGPPAASRGAIPGAPPPAGIRHAGSLPALGVAAAQYPPASAAPAGHVPYNKVAKGGGGPAAGGAYGSASSTSGSYRSVAAGGAGGPSSGLAPRPASAQQRASDGSIGNGGGASERIFTSPGVAQQQGARAFSSPLPNAKRVEPLASMDSPGLDDFAHMGLITDLLE